jgi:hypothetical protein
VTTATATVTAAAATAPSPVVPVLVLVLLLVLTLLVLLVLVLLVLLMLLRWRSGCVSACVRTAAATVLKRSHTPLVIAWRPTMPLVLWRLRTAAPILDPRTWVMSFSRQMLSSLLRVLRLPKAPHR